MKNQYFADVNDYRKYGILHTLVGNSEMKAAICWMLTNNDTRTDGKFIDYLHHPEKWRKYDPDLFDALASCMTNHGNRSVKWAEENHLIQSAIYFAELLGDEQEKRRRYFAKFHAIAANSDLVFFDPDNGIEVKSKPFGCQGSNKYIYWRELVNTFNSGKSILVYQHFIREKRELFTQQLVDRFCEHLPILEMYTLRTANVLFLLIPQPRHQQYLAKKCTEISTNWYSQIQVSKHRYTQQFADGFHH